MKRVSIFAALALLLCVSCDTTSTPQATTDEVVETAVSGDIAYIRSEQVLTQSQIFVTEGVALRTKTEKAQAAWAKAEQGFQYEVSKLQEKYQKGLITSANAQSEQASIEKRVKNYQTKTQKEAQELEEESFVFSNRAQDLYRRAVAQLNADKKYKMILDATAVLDADASLDLTEQVLAIVDELYAAEKAESK